MLHVRHARSPPPPSSTPTRAHAFASRPRFAWFATPPLVPQLLEITQPPVTSVTGRAVGSMGSKCTSLWFAVDVRPCPIVSRGWQQDAGKESGSLTHLLWASAPCLTPALHMQHCFEEGKTLLAGCLRAFLLLSAMHSEPCRQQGPPRWVVYDRGRGLMFTTFWLRALELSLDFPISECHGT